MRVWKCDSCSTIIDDTPPVTVQVLVQLEPDDDDDDECEEWEMQETQFCSLGCLASWSMGEALTHPETAA